MKAKETIGEFNMCRRKRRYTARAAYRAAGRQNRCNGSEPHVYHCPICFQFHIGRNKKKVKVKIDAQRIWTV